ncbi:MAG: SDR family oxidoreductase [bacterium]|nr:SDR family oxidoreductase [bacterium]
MKDKICLITGASAGIGKATALGLAQQGATVIMVSRNENSGRKAAAEVTATSGNKHVHFLGADLSSQSSIRNLATTFNNRYPRLDVLINNAGTFHTELKLSAEGIEMQFAVNHLAGFLLTHLLLDKIKLSPYARIINVSSRGHKLGTIHFEDLNLEKNYDGLTAYTQSKLANVLFTVVLAEKLKHLGITVNCLHPGGIKTTIGTRNSHGLYHWIWKLNPFLKSPEEGAQTSLFLADSKKAEGITGKYFYKCKVVPSSPLSNNRELGEKLWDISSKLTSLDKGIRL